MSEAQSATERLPPVPGVAAASRFLGVPAWTAVAVTAALAAGVALRLIYPGTIEYHDDEQFSFEHVKAVLDGGPWPAFGMTMSIGGPNPGMSVWIFILLGYLFDTATPPELARAVQWMNIAAISALVAFALAAVPRARREPWLWAAALWAVNPLAVIYGRKIWPPCTLPVFMVGMIAAWHYRRHWLGSFLFALIAVLCGQIHPTATFLGAALFAWAMIADWTRWRWRAFRFSGLAAGAAIGVLPALYWFYTYAGSGGGKLNDLRLPWLAFYRVFLTQPFGFGADGVLGPTAFPDFLRWPYWGIAPTWLGAALHVAIGVVAVGLFLAAGYRLLRRRRIALPVLLVGGNETGRLIRAVFFGFGAILTLLSAAGGGLYPHYLIVTTPIMMLWLVSLTAYADGGVLGNAGRGVLTALCVIDAALILSLLAYVHEVGNIYGEFGPSWEWQMNAPPIGHH
jgi:hypothetical protein